MERRSKVCGTWTEITVKRSSLNSTEYTIALKWPPEEAGDRCKALSTLGSALSRQQEISRPSSVWFKVPLCHSSSFTNGPINSAGTTRSRGSGQTGHRVLSYYSCYYYYYYTYIMRQSIHFISSWQVVWHVATSSIWRHNGVLCNVQAAKILFIRRQKEPHLRGLCSQWRNKMWFE